MAEQVKWTKELIARLKVLAGEGLSGSAVARALNEEFGLRLTRNAVAGAAARVGVSLKSQVRGRPKVRSALRKRQRGRAAVVRGVGETIAVPAGPPPELKYAPWGCKWLGGALDAHESCHERAAEGGSYCHTHMKRVYLPPRERQKVEKWMNYRMR